MLLFPYNSLEMSSILSINVNGGKVICSELLLLLLFL
jgi:hypothetical protein